MSFNHLPYGRLAVGSPYEGINGMGTSGYPPRDGDKASGMTPGVGAGTERREMRGSPSPAEIVRAWGRIGCIGFGGPPTHIALLRELCVSRNKWIDAAEFEDAVAACNLLPGPASTQLAIYYAWRVGGRPGALLGGLSFIVPGFILIVGLAALFLSGSPPDIVKGAGAGAAVAAVALQAGVNLLPSSWRRAPSHVRWSAYLGAGALAPATLGPWLVLVLLSCGLVELVIRGARLADDRGLTGVVPPPVCWPWSRRAGG